MHEIKKGDVVKLKSGGPLMTVENIGAYEATGGQPGAYCVWFEQGKEYSKVFDPAVLTPAGEEIDF